MVPDEIGPLVELIRRPGNDELECTRTLPAVKQSSTDTPFFYMVTVRDATDDVNQIRPPVFFVAVCRHHSSLRIRRFHEIPMTVS